MLMNSKFTRKICGVRNVWNDEWSDVMAKHAAHGRTQAANQSAMSYNQTESLNKDNQQDRCSLCLGQAVGRALERRRKCSCSNSPHSMNESEIISTSRTILSSVPHLYLRMMSSRTNHSRRFQNRSLKFSLK